MRLREEEIQRIKYTGFTAKLSSLFLHSRALDAFELLLSPSHLFDLKSRVGRATAFMQRNNHNATTLLHNAYSDKTTSSNVFPENIVTLSR